MSAPLLALDRVSSGYGSSRVVRDVSLDIASGEIVALIGKNGMGKSTLLKTIMGFLRLQTGGIALAGRDIAAVPSHRKASLGLAYVPQEQPIFQDLTVHDNLRLGLASDAGLAAGIAEMAQAFPVLGRRLRQRAGTLSGGEQKMLIVARGLIARPRLMLLDEVTEGLQPSVVDRLAEALTAARRDRGTAMLIVEQHLPFVLGISDRFAVFKSGEIVDSGPVDAAAAVRIEAHTRL